MIATAQHPKVAVVVLNWNGWRDTVECLNSLKLLDYPNYWVVVVDNGSTDDSVVRIQEAHPEVVLIKVEQNLGFAGGNNVGIRYALKEGAQYVWLLNNDTKVEPNALAAMVQKAITDPKIGAVGSVLYYMHQPVKVQAWGGGWVSLWWGLSRHYTTQVPPEKLHYLTGASLLLRREVLESVGLLDEGFFMYWEDADYGFRLRRAGWRLEVAEGSRVWHKESASVGGKGPTLDVFFNASGVRFFRRHAPFAPLPILIGTVGRIVKRALNGEGSRMRAVWRGLVRGIVEKS